MCSHKGSNSLEQKTTQSTLNYLIEGKIMVPTQLLLKKVSKMDKLHCSQEKKKMQFESQIPYRTRNAHAFHAYQNVSANISHN